MKWTCVFTPGLLAGTLLVATVACKTTPEKTAAEKATTASAKKPPSKLVSTSRNDDVGFQSFVSRLRQAVRAHDANEIAGMMTSDFGYQFEPRLEGPGVFAYWDEHNLWSELDLVLGEQFLVNNVGGSNEYMVAPAEFVTNPENYTGYRAGIQLVNGSWKFAYFVSGQESGGNITPL